MRTARLLPFALASVATFVTGCNVYDPSLLDGSHDAAPRDATMGDTAPMEGGADVPDVTQVTDGDAAVDVVVPVDSGLNCTALLAGGHNCLEPFAGQSASADDPRLLAPWGVAAISSTPARVAVTDPGVGRVMQYHQDGSSPTRIIGSGVLGATTGDTPALTAQLTLPTGIAYLPSGDAIIADAGQHTLFYYTATTQHLAPFVTTTFTDGPWGITLLDSSTLLIAADNKISSITFTGATGASPVTLVGQSCGVTCPGFNTTPTTGANTQLNFPTGVGADESLFIYIADTKNCLIRRASRSGTTYTTSVFAGTACDTGQIYDPAVGSIPATSAHLGRVGDVRVTNDGTVFFTDLTHCAILAVPTSGPTAGTLHAVAGSAAGCGSTSGTIGSPLGRIGGLALSDDRQTVYFVDVMGQQIGSITVTAAGPGPAMFPVSPGPVPSATDTPAQLRSGRVSGLTASGATVYWSGFVEGRVYRWDTTTTPPLEVIAGAGTQRLTIGISAPHLESAGFTGLATDGTFLSMALTDHQVIGTAQGLSLFPAAGMYDVAGTPTLTGNSSADTISAPVWPALNAGHLYFGTQAGIPRVYTASDPVRGLTPLVAVLGGGTMVPTVATGVPATSASVGRPTGIAFDGSGNMFVGDDVNHVVWKVAGGTATILAGQYQSLSPTSDTSSDPRGVAIPTPTALAFDGAHTLYIADTSMQRIRAVDLTANTIVTVAGQGTAATSDYVDPTTVALGQVSALAWATDRLYFGESETGRVRVLRFAP